MILRPTLSLLLAWMMLLSVLPPTTAHAVFQQDNDKASSTDEVGLRFRLSEGKEIVVAQPSPKPLAATTSLSEVETKKLLARF